MGVFLKSSPSVIFLYKKAKDFILVKQIIINIYLFIDFYTIKFYNFKLKKYVTNFNGDRYKKAILRTKK